MRTLAALFGVFTGLILVAQAAAPLSFPPRAGVHLVLPVEAIDGDTVRIYWLVEDTVRIYGINAPELHGPDAARGQAARAHLAGLLPKGPTPLVLHGREKYGRTLGELLDGQGKSLGRLMIDAGHAKAWDGRGPKP